MGSSIPACGKFELLRAAALASLLGLACCGRGDPAGEFRVVQVHARWDNGRLTVQGEQRLTLSAEARTALLHGVPLTIETEFILRESESQARLARASEAFEIRYLPLSQRYRVSGPTPQQVTTYPRLRHALAQIAHLDFALSTGALPAGDYQLLVRSHLDHQSLPPPMRLPALLDPAWQHASAWTSWPLTIDLAPG